MLIKKTRKGRHYSVAGFCAFGGGSVLLAFFEQELCLVGRSDYSPGNCFPAKRGLNFLERSGWKPKSESE